MAALRRRDLARCFGRSLWLQASWSFRGMQGLGFAYALEPALRRLHGNGPRYRSAVARHLEFFNTHPFLAAAVLGAVIRLEQGGEGGTEGSVRLKQALMGPYGAVGDSLYWGAVKPLLVLASLHLAYQGRVVAPLLFVSAFTVANLGGRLAAFCAGYRNGEGVVGVMARPDLLGWARRLKVVCAVLLGTLVSMAGRVTLLDAWAVPGWAWGGTGWALALLTAWLLHRRANVVWLVYLVALLSAGIAAWR